MIKTRANLIHKQNKYIVVVLATDHGNVPLSSEVDVIIDVTASNDKPQFKQSFYEVTIPENFTNLARVARVTAISRNPNLMVLYRIHDGNVPSTNSLRTFHINSQGLVLLYGQLDRETIPSYTLTIVAETAMAFPLSSYATLSVILSDVNDCAPEFSQPLYDGSVSENLPTSTPVLKVSALDRDLQSSIEYSMLSGGQYFSIHPETGLIRTKQVFDRETRDFYGFQVLATDSEKRILSSHSTVYVRIADTNDLAPVFQSNYFETSIKENLPNGTLISTVTATDGDSGVNAEITYAIRSGNPDGRFRIGSDSGRVFVNGEIDFESKIEYNLVILAWDGKHQSTTTLVIRVENENDNNPVFKITPHRASIEENSPAASLVTTLKAFDPDKLWIKYELSGQVKNVFDINSDTGNITTKTPLDRETKPTYTFQAYARDHDERTGAVRVIVQVLDRNDNAPKFQKASLRMSILENAPLGAIVGKVHAVDADDVTSGNGRVSYKLVRDRRVSYGIVKDTMVLSGTVVDNEVPFMIDSSTGVIRTNDELDRENRSTFILTVNASDHGKPSRTTYADVTVSVLDVNDHAPKFAQTVYEKDVAENVTIGMTILQLAASDEDLGVNANLR